MFDVWNDKLWEHDSIHHLEDRAGIGKNLMPWNLGPLVVMGKEISSGFGQAYSLLSKRQCQSNHEFLHALLGLVKPVSDRPLERHFDHEFERIAKLYLAVGEYSRLRMTPPLKNYDVRWWRIVYMILVLRICWIEHEQGMRLGCLSSFSSYQESRLHASIPGAVWNMKTCTMGCSYFGDDTELDCAWLLWDRFRCRSPLLSL